MRLFVLVFMAWPSYQNKISAVDYPGGLKCIFRFRLKKLASSTTGRTCSSPPCRPTSATTCSSILRWWTTTTTAWASCIRTSTSRTRSTTSRTQSSTATSDTESRSGSPTWIHYKYFSNVASAAFPRLIVLFKWLSVDGESLVELRLSCTQLVTIRLYYIFIEWPTEMASSEIHKNKKHSPTFWVCQFASRKATLLVFPTLVQNIFPVSQKLLLLVAVVRLHDGDMHAAGWCPGASVTSAKAIRVGVVLNKKNFFFFAGNLAWTLKTAKSRTTCMRESTTTPSWRSSSSENSPNGCRSSTKEPRTPSSKSQSPRPEPIPKVLWSSWKESPSSWSVR